MRCRRFWVWGRGVYSAPTRCCQPMLDCTSVVKGVGMMYKSCGVVSLINSSIFLGTKHNFVNTPKPDYNHLKSKYSPKKRQKKSNKFTIVLYNISHFKSQYINKLSRKHYNLQGGASIVKTCWVLSYICMWSLFWVCVKGHVILLSNPLSTIFYKINRAWIIAVRARFAS